MIVDFSDGNAGAVIPQLTEIGSLSNLSDAATAVNCQARQILLPL
jgi:hypothetical protein